MTATRTGPRLRRAGFGCSGSAKGALWRARRGASFELGDLRDDLGQRLMHGLECFLVAALGAGRALADGAQAIFQRPQFRRAARAAGLAADSARARGWPRPPPRRSPRTRVCSSESWSWRIACSMVSRWPSCCSVWATRALTAAMLSSSWRKRALVALQPHGFGEAVVEFGDALFECADLRLAAARGGGLLEPAVDVAEALVHVGQRAHVRPLRDARRQLLDGGAQRLHVTLAGGTGLDVLEAAGKARHVAMQAARSRWRPRRAQRQRRPALP